MAPMQDRARIAIAHHQLATGDVQANLGTITTAARAATRAGIDLLVFPELTLTGLVPPEDVPDLAISRTDEPLHILAGLTTHGPSLVVGFIEHGANRLYYNSQAYLEDGAIRAIQRKVYLPGYGIFDEARSFASGGTFGAFDTKFGRAAMLICEDAWHPALPYAAVCDGATILLTSAASPDGGTSVDVSSQELWTAVNRALAVTLKCVYVFANRVGSDRHLEYWGGSHIIAPSGKMLAFGSREPDQFISSDVDLTQIGIQRHRFRYVQDDRLDLTITELQHIRATRRMAVP